MADYDSNIQLKVGLKPEDIQKSARALRLEIKKIFDDSAGKEFDATVMNIQKHMAETSAKSRSLAKDLQSLANRKIPTDEYKKLTDEFSKLEKKWIEMREKEDEYESAGKKIPETLFQNTRKVQDRLQEIDGELEDLVKKGKDFTLGKDTDEFKGKSAELERLNDLMKIDLSKFKAKVEVDVPPEEEKKVELLRTSVIRLFKDFPQFAKNASDKISTFTKNLTAAVSSKIKAGLAKVNEHIKNIGKHAGSSGLSLKKLLLAFLGFRSLTTLFNKLKSSALDSIKAMAKFAPEVNKNMSDVTNAFAQLKNSMGSIVQPLLNALAPALIYIANLATRVANAIASFIALLTGQKYILKATKVNKDYAKSLEGTGGAAKEANKQLAQYDKLIVIQSQEDGGGGGSGIDDALWEKTDAVSPWAEKVKDIIGQIWDVFKKAWDEKGAAVMESAKYALASIKEMMLTIGRTWLEVWTNGTGQACVESLLDLLRMVLDLIGSIAEAFTNAWKTDNAGFDYVTSIFTMLTNINELLVSIGDSFVNAFQSPVGIEIFEHILHIFTGIHDIIGNIALRLTEAWKSAGLGDTIVLNLFNIINSILGTIDSIAISTANWAAQLNFEPLLTAINSLLESIWGFVDVIGTNLLWIWENFFEPLGAWLVEEALPVAIQAISDAIDGLAGFCQTAFETWTMLWDDGLGQLASEAGEIVLTILEGIGKAIKAIGENETAVLVIQALVTTILGAIAVFKTFSLVTSGVGAVIGFLTNPIGLVIVIIGALIAVIILCILHWDDIKAKVKEVWDKITDWVDKGVKKVKDKLADLGAKLKERKDKIVAGFRTMRDNIKSIWESIKTTAVNTWERIWGGMKGIINKIIGGVEKFANGVVWAINKVVDAANAISFDIPESVPAFLGGGTHVGFNLPHVSEVSLPRLAQGAVIPPNKEFLAVLGDQKSGQNIEAPLDTIVEALKLALNENGGNNAPIILQLNGRELARAVWKEDEKRYKQSGKYTGIAFT